MTSGTDLIDQVAIYQCAPQDDDKADITKFEELDSNSIGSYPHAKEIVEAFVGELEQKEYYVPSRKTARIHDFGSTPLQIKLNSLCKFDKESDSESSSESESSENSDEDPESSGDTDSEGEEDSEQSDGNTKFGELTKELCEKYNTENNSRDCILLFVQYEKANDRFEASDRIMTVQMPFIESDTYSPESADDDADTLFTELQDVFDTTLKKSVLYPYQPLEGESDEETDEEESGDSEEETDESEEDESEEGPELGKAYLYQRNGQATYWHEFLGLLEEPHEDELLLKNRRKVVRKQESEDEEPDDGFSEVESIEDLTEDDVPDEVTNYDDSGLVIELGSDITIAGLTVRDVRQQDPIRIGYRNGEIVVEFRGREPKFKPVGQSKYRIEENEENEDEDERDLDIFPELSEYPDLD